MYAIEKTVITIICENTTFRSDVLGDSGLSILIEALFDNRSSVKILFDACENPEVFERNVNALKLDLSDVDAVVISHGHHDHTGGLLKALEIIGKRVPVVLHPDALLPKFALKDRIRYTGIPFDVSELKKRSILLFSKNPLKIASGITVLGEIPRTTNYEKVEDYYILRGDNLVEDPMYDDQALVIEMSDGTIGIITGCSHSGIINILRYAMEITGKREIKFVIGGFHLINANEERINKTWEDLKQINPQYISPMHCSGPYIVAKVLSESPEKYLMLHAGHSITFTSTK